MPQKHYSLQLINALILCVRSINLYIQAAVFFFKLSLYQELKPETWDVWIDKTSENIVGKKQKKGSRCVRIGFWLHSVLSLGTCTTRMHQLVLEWGYVMRFSSQLCICNKFASQLIIFFCCTVFCGLATIPLILKYQRKENTSMFSWDIDKFISFRGIIILFILVFCQ